MTIETLKEAKKQESADANRDPLTGTPGAHPIGTGVGAAGGAVAGAAVGAMAGPIGAAVGMVAGAITGGLAGKGVAEGMDPTVEDAYWRENYWKQSYVENNVPYAIYQHAYRAGYEGRGLYPGKTYAEAEADLQRAYELSDSNAALAWEKAKHATRDAWNRLETVIPGDSDGDGR